MHDVLPEKNQETASLYDANYYQTGLGLPYERNSHWLTFFGLIADEVIRSLKPRRVFDAGCAMGFLVESFWDRGVEASGVDVSAYAISQVRRDIQPYCSEASLIDPIPGNYDLLTCIEVLEHVLPEQTETVIANLAGATDTILFSSSPTDLTEATHFNVRPVIGWLKIFANAGFWPDCIFDASFIAPHAVLLRKQQPPSEDLLGLFSEKTRIKCALVEREQRIGNLDNRIAELNKHIESYGVNPVRAEEHERLVKQLSIFRDEHEQALNEITALHNERSHLHLEIAGFREKQDNVAIELQRALEANGQLSLARQKLSSDFADFRSTHEKVSEELSSIRDEYRQLSANLGSARQDSKRLSSELATLRQTSDALVQELAQRRAKLDTAEWLLFEQQVESNRLREEIAHVNRSAAWRFTTKYRSWLDNRRNSSFGVRLYDRAAKWLLRRSGIGWKAASSLNQPPVEVETSFKALDVSSVVIDHVPLEPVSDSVKDAKVVEYVDGGLEAKALTSESYESWLERTEFGQSFLTLQSELSHNLRLQPTVSVLVPVYKVPLKVLKEAIESVVSQTYEKWELCIVHGFKDDLEGREYLVSLADGEPRIKLQLLDENHGISGNSNAALASVQGEFVALLDHDDTLAPFALFELVKAINEQPDAGLLYSDKDCIDEDSVHRLRPLFKPQWCPDTVLSANYLTHLTAVRTNILREIGGWRSETDGAQDWDIFLRAIDAGAKPVFVQGVLYHWRIISTSVASGGMTAKPYAANGQIKALDDHAQRRGLLARAVFDENAVLKMDWKGAEQFSVTIILTSSSAASNFTKWARDVDELTEWPDLEIIVPGDTSTQLGKRIRAVPAGDEESVAARLNQAVQASHGEVLVFLDESVLIDDRHWLKELVGPLEQSELGIVGAKLLDPSTWKIRHAGVVFNLDGSLDYIFSQEPEHVCEQFGAPIWYRNWSAVAGALFAVRRTAFENAGGFKDSPEFPRHDVDLCLRIGIASGYRIAYNPFARFSQTRTSLLESWLTSDGPQVSSAYIREICPSGDPYFHNELESRSGKVSFVRPRTSITTADYAAESRALVNAFDASSELIRRSQSGTTGLSLNRIHRITWVLPEFHHAFYGGVHTILRFADYFRRLHGIEAEFVFPGRVPETVMKSRLATAFPELASAARVTRLRSHEDWSRIRESDVTISTLWTTAYAALHFQKTRRKFYFVQDYESLFYPAGSTYALVEATYRFGYHGICNTRSLCDTYRAFGGGAEYFDPCIDSQYFYESNRKHDALSPLTLFCYARPGHPRNCFELLANALQKLKSRMGDEIRIISAGANWNPVDYGLQGVVENLGLIGYSATGALYRTCDAGVVMMLTQHPSYLPMELMACGSLVITNRNRYTGWLLEHERNCLLSETSPTAIAETIERGLRDKPLREQITQRAAQQVRTEHSDWNEQCNKIYEYMLSKC